MNSYEHHHSQLSYKSVLFIVIINFGYSTLELSTICGGLNDFRWNLYTEMIFVKLQICDYEIEETQTI